MFTKTYTSIIVAFTVLAQALAFAPTSSVAIRSAASVASSNSALDMSPSAFAFEPILSNSNTIAASTIDPTTVLSQVLSGLINTPIILAVPILAAVAVASLVAWLIVAYANPADPDEE